MVKTQNIDTEKLEKAIERSGLKTSFIYETIGISRQAFDRKRKGYVSFRKSEVFTLKTILHLTDDETVAIFFPEDVRL